MYRTIKSLAVALAVTTAAACGDAAMPTESALAPAETALMAKPTSSQLTFSYTQSQSSQQSQSATGGLGTINFTGSMTTGNPCVDVTASHSASSNTVTLTVTAAPNGSACIQVITYNNYQGNVSGLDSGTYTFNVVHDLGGSTTTAYSGSVLVL